jgi:DNA-binding transcriptional regulator LsrR (DeoR family)
MLDSKKRLSDQQREELRIRCAELFYLGDHPLTQAKIAEVLHIHPSYVCRLLREARQKGVVDIHILTPVRQGTLNRLIREFELRDACIVPVPEGEESEQKHPSSTVLNEPLGKAAAQYLEQAGSPLRNGCSVGVGCGAALLETVLAFSRGRFRGLQLYPLALEGMPEYVHVAPSTIIGLMKHRFPDGCTTYAPLLMPRFFEPDAEGSNVPPGEKPSDPAREMQDLFGKVIEKLNAKTQNLDLALVGIGHVDLTARDRSFSEILRKSKVTEAQIHDCGVVGEIANRPFDRQGNDRFDELGLLQQLTRAVPLDLLKALAKKKSVVAIAGGREKVEAIYTALRSRMVNILVTDSLTAEALLEMPSKRL